MMRVFLLVWGVVLLAQPNVLFIAIDDLNNWALDEYPGAQTPHIDRLAQRGVTFTNAHCAVPACNPSRTALLTGLLASTSGVYFNWQDWRQCERLKGVVTLPEHFQQQGYKTLGGGKIYHAHSLSAEAYEGFMDPAPWDAFFPSKTQQMPMEIDPPKMPVNGHPTFYRSHFDWSAMDLTDDEMADGQVVNWAVKQLSQSHQKPLFLAVGIYRPHIPWYTPKHWFERYPIGSVKLPEVRPDDLDDVPDVGKELARQHWQKWMVENDKWREGVQAYLASVNFADAMVGRLLDALDAGPMAKNTVVVLWSDHGYHLGHKEHWEKFALWEQTTQVPMIISVPDGATGQTATPASLLDVYPTLVDLCGGAQAHLEGKSLRPWIENPSAPVGPPVVTTHGPNRHAVRSEHWRYIRYDDGSEELYDHRSDPQEFRNLAGRPEVAKVVATHAAALPTRNVDLSPKNRPARKKTKK